MEGEKQPKQKLFTDYGILELSEEEKREVIRWYEDWHERMRINRRLEYEQGILTSRHYTR